MYLGLLQSTLVWHKMDHNKPSNDDKEDDNDLPDDEGILWVRNVEMSQNMSIPKKKPYPRPYFLTQGSHFWHLFPSECLHDCCQQCLFLFLICQSFHPLSLWYYSYLWDAVTCLHHPCQKWLVLPPLTWTLMVSLHQSSSTSSIISWQIVQLLKYAVKRRQFVLYPSSVPLNVLPCSTGKSLPWRINQLIWPIHIHAYHSS